MLWWQKVGLSIVLVPAALIGVAHLDAAIASYDSGVSFELEAQNDHYPSDESHLIVYLPGILADGHQSSRPMVATWLQYGDVLSVSYTGQRFDADEVVEQIVGYITTDTHASYTLIGSSMGGLLAVDVIDGLRAADESDKVRSTDLIIVDAPSGSRDMLGGGNVVAPVLRLLPAGRLANWLLTPLMQAMLAPPKHEDMQPGLDSQVVVEQAVAMMRQFPYSVWRDQLAYMASHRPPQAADFASISQVDYLQCDLRNVTVSQPQAAQTWQAAASWMTVWQVDSPHTAYSELPDLWNQVFHQILGGNGKVLQAPINVGALACVTD